MTQNGERGDRRTWAVGGATLIGLGVGLVFIRTSVLLFMASLLIGIGAGPLATSLLPRRRG